MELFEKFEVNRDPRWQVLTKLVGASLVLHLAFLWAAIYVPVFRDTLNIAALIANTRFVEKDYKATQIGGDVQLVQLTDKFHYPEGYFAFEQQLATGQVPGQAAAADPFAPKIISQWSKESKVDPEASPSPSPAATASPTASPAASASPSASAVAQVQASPSPSPLTTEQAQEQLEKTAAENNVTLPDENEINKKVLKDFAAYANDLKNQGKLDF